ncbi:MAG: GNAT family N-acetyltransferase [Gemmatimonadetes bacterium]|nr:GNAT family N-acetyltransferase [Gemmatimonadota bacterium]
MSGSVTPQIRDATPADLPAALRLVAASGLPTAGIRDHFHEFLVAELDGRVVGVAGLECYEAAALLRSVAVDPELRGRKLGTQLTEAALARCRHPGCEAVYLLTESAEPFFAHFGFRTVARASLPAALAASEELRGACPASAVCMELPMVIRDRENS